jgi:hypothetical protein
VLELLEGESLAERLLKGPLALPDVLRFGIQIAPRSTRRTAVGSSTATSNRATSC